LKKFIPDLKKPDHATIHRRVSKLGLKLENNIKTGKEITIAIRGLCPLSSPELKS